jgi:predicted small secreted protein
MRRGLVICALAAAALTTAACGGGTANVGQDVAKAATKTAAAQSAKFHIDLTETVGPIGPLHFTADGVADSAGGSADMTMDLSPAASLLGATANPGQWQAHFIFDNGVFYLHLPALDQYLNGKTWVKADLNALAQKAGVNLQQLLQMAGSQDPTKALQLLQSVGDVKEVGSAKLDGVDTTEYGGTVDVQKVAQLLGGNLARQLGQAKVATIPIEVWIDSNGLVRQVHETYSYAVSGTRATTDLTESLSDFGVQTSITPPPADQTVDVAQLKGAPA